MVFVVAIQLLMSVVFVMGQVLLKVTIVTEPV
jgi:hypothetical protein